MRRFSQVLSEGRRKADLTLRALGKKAQMSPTVLSEIENRRRLPPKDDHSITNLAKAINIEANYLIELAKHERKINSVNTTKRLQNINPNLAWSLNRLVDNVDDYELEEMFKKFLDDNRGRLDK